MTIQNLLHCLKVCAPAFCFAYGLLLIHEGLFWLFLGFMLVVMFF